MKANVLFFDKKPAAKDDSLEDLTAAVVEFDAVVAALEASASSGEQA